MERALVRALRQEASTRRTCINAVKVDIASDLLAEILEQIDGALYEDPTTGDIRMIAVRNPVDVIHDVVNESLAAQKDTKR